MRDYLLWVQGRGSVPWVIGRTDSPLGYPGYHLCMVAVPVCFTLFYNWGILCIQPCIFANIFNLEVSLIYAKGPYRFHIEFVLLCSITGEYCSNHGTCYTDVIKHFYQVKIPYSLCFYTAFL